MKKDAILYLNPFFLPFFYRLLPHIRGNVGFVFTKLDLVEVRDKLTENRVRAPARAGALAPCNVYIEPMNTGLGPEKTSFFQALSIPTKISKGSIEIIVMPIRNPEILTWSRNIENLLKLWINRPPSTSSRKESGWMLPLPLFSTCWTSLLSLTGWLSKKFTIPEPSSTPRFLTSSPRIFSNVSWR